MNRSLRKTATRLSTTSRFLPAGIIAFCFISVCGVGGAGAEPDVLTVGYGQVDITPPLGVEMPGYFSGRKATAVQDPLLAKALVLSKNDTTLAIVAIDLISIKAPVVDEIREDVERRTGIPKDHVFVHATHTHTGADVSEIKDKLPGEVAEAVEKALKQRVSENRVTYGKAEEDSVAFIRRYLMKDGTVRTNPGRANPDIVRPIGEIDPTVHVLAFNDAKTMLVSYGLHPDCVGGTKLTADYPYHLTEALREAVGDDWNVLYLNACCGNVNHINVNNPDQRSSYEESRRIGRKIARAAQIAYRNAEPFSVDVLGAETREVRCPIRKVPEDVYEWAKRQMEADPEEASKRRFNERTPSRIIALAESEDQYHTSEVIVSRIGSMGLVGLPAEVFVEIGRDIKVHSLLSPTLVIGLTGGSMGYVPHPRGYDEIGYEGTFASARYAPTTPVLWSDTAISLLKELNE